MYDYIVFLYLSMSVLTLRLKTLGADCAPLRPIEISKHRIQQDTWDQLVQSCPRIARLTLANKGDDFLWNMSNILQFFK